MKIDNLDLNAINTILGALSELPFKQVAQLIYDIQVQVKAQLEPPKPEPEPEGDAEPVAAPVKKTKPRSKTGNFM